jgi:hypothetical protein
VGASATAFWDKLQPLMIGGFGTRPHGGLSVTAPKAKLSPQAIYVLTHVDVFPAGKDQAARGSRRRDAQGRGEGRPLTAIVKYVERDAGFEIPKTR